MRDLRCGWLVSWLGSMGCDGLVARFALGGGGRGAQKVRWLRGLVASVVALAAIGTISAPMAVANGGAAAATGKEGPYLAPEGKTRALPGPEVPQLRTRSSRTYQDRSGALVARVGSEAVNYRDGVPGSRSRTS